MSFHVIVPAGGAGTRLWPLSRKDAPKFLGDLTGAGRSLVQQTVDRLGGIADEVIIVTGVTHAEAVAGQVPGARIVVEPCARGTMGAIGLAAALVERDDPDAIIGSFAADHLINNEDAFREAVSRAITAAQRGYVATIGITPDSPSTAYGYIQASIPIDDEGEILSVAQFVEKPDATTAAEYLASGSFLWNAGMFVARAGVLMGALERYHPELAAPLRALARRWDEDRQSAIDELWLPMDSAVIDTAVAEPLAADGGVAVVPVDMGWSDVGDYASLAEVIDEPLRSRQVAPGGQQQTVIEVDSPASLIYAGTKPVVVVGIPGAVVVDMDDVLFVTTQDSAQKVKDAVAALDAAGREDLR